MDRLTEIQSRLAVGRHSKLGSFADVTYLLRIAEAAREFTGALYAPAMWDEADSRRFGHLNAALEADDD